MINVVDKVLAYIDKVTRISLSKGQVVVDKYVGPGQASSLRPPSGVTSGDAKLEWQSKVL